MVCDAADSASGATKPTSGAISNMDSCLEWTPEQVLAQLPPHSRPLQDTKSPLPFFHLLERLKTTKREGWRRFGILDGESISDHMYRMAILTMLLPSALASRVNIPHCTRMALVHDMAEAVVGDITPVDPITKVEKSRRETATMDYVCARLLDKVDGGDSGAEIRKVWQEYEDNETLEAKCVHDIDKIELLLQMVEYERRAEGRLDVGEFTWVATRIVIPEVRDWANEVLEERRKYWEMIGKDPSWVSDGQAVSRDVTDCRTVDGWS